jgi:hypothetical protein
LGVWTTIAAQAEVFFAVFMGTAIILMGERIDRAPLRRLEVQARIVPPLNSG